MLENAELALHCAALGVERPETVGAARHQQMQP